MLSDALGWLRARLNANDSLLRTQDGCENRDVRSLDRAGKQVPLVPALLFCGTRDVGPIRFQASLSLRYSVALLMLRMAAAAAMLPSACLIASLIAMRSSSPSDRVGRSEL